MSTCRLYPQDHHFADRGLNPLRGCEMRWDGIGNQLRKNLPLSEYVRLAGYAAVLAALTAIAFFFAVVSVTLKACIEKDHFTQREAAAKAHQLLTKNITCKEIECDLHSGAILVKSAKDTYYRWTPGYLEYAQIEPKAGARTGKLQKIDIKPMTEYQAKSLYVHIGTVQSASYAPYLGIVILRKKDDPRVYYRGPGMDDFSRVRQRTILLPTGGTITAEGNVLEEKLVPIP